MTNDQTRLSFVNVFQVQANNESMPLPDPEDEDPEAVILPNPKMTISVESSDILQVTMTKSCLDVLSKLGKVFTC